MKLLLVQSHVGGPWRWAIVDGQVCVAVSPIEYRYFANCRAAAQKFKELVPGLKLEARPSVQLSLFGASQVVEAIQGRVRTRTA